MDIIEFDCSVIRIKTMADGGLRFEFDAGERYIQQAAMLMECKRFGATLRIVAEPILTNLDDETKREPETGTDTVDSRRTAKRRDQRQSRAV